MTAEPDTGVRLGLTIKDKLSLFIIAVAHCMKTNVVYDVKQTMYTGLAMKRYITVHIQTVIY